MAKAKKKRGPKSTLAQPAHVTKIREVLAGQGYHYLKDAAKAIGMDDAAFTSLIHHGRSKRITEERAKQLRSLQIYDLIPVREAS